MMPSFAFKEWVGLRDIFGFEREVNQAQEPQNTDDLPVKQLSLGVLMERLGRNTLPLGLPKSKFLTEMQWGNQPGAVRVVWTPRLNVKIQKLHHDREGNNVWALKKFFFVNDRDFAGKEDVVADEIFDQVKLVADEKLEAVLENKEFRFEDLINALSAKVQQQDNETIDFQFMKKLNENEYDFLFYIRGGGVGTMYGPRGQRPALALIVKMGYSESTGLITSIAQLVEGVDDTSNWTIQPAEFYEVFMPTQPKREIIECIVTALKWF
jgi:hypothetical protein